MISPQASRLIPIRGGSGFRPTPEPRGKPILPKLFLTRILIYIFLSLMLGTAKGEKMEDFRNGRGIGLAKRDIGYVEPSKCPPKRSCVKSTNCHPICAKKRVRFGTTETWEYTVERKRKLQSVCSVDLRDHKEGKDPYGKHAKTNIPPK